MLVIQEITKEEKTEKLQTFDSSYFLNKGHFEEDGTQNYLVFQPSFKYFKTPTRNDRVIACLSKGQSGQKKVTMFLEINQAKTFLSLTRPHSQICIRMYIFNFKTQTNKKKIRIPKKNKKNYRRKKNISRKLIKKINLRLPR